MVVEGSNDETLHFSGFSVVGAGTDMKKSAAKASAAKPGLESVRQACCSRHTAESPLTPTALCIYGCLSHENGQFVT